MPAVRLSIEPQSFPTKNAVAESFQIRIASNHCVEITGYDAEGALWGVRDFVHYYAKEWIEGLKAGAANREEFNFVSSPTIPTRGLWSWWYGCNDPYAYIERVSEWKHNTIIFWNRGVPLDAEHLNAHAHERGVKLWWGFSWGWTANDFTDASPKLARRLMSLYEEQKKRIGAELGVLCPNADETPQSLMDYVLDVFENQYAWIPDIDGIYFQTATEIVCPCEKCKTTARGEGFVRTIVPIIKEMHRRYPKLKISCGVHNTGDKETFKALQAVPDYCNICWEEGVKWAPDLDVFRDQMTYRGAAEDIAGIYRITMCCGMILRGAGLYQNERDRNWLPRIEKLWEYLEEGQPEGLGNGFRLIEVDGKAVGYPCTSDWRPKGGRMIDNPNFQELLTWSREMAKGPAAKKAIFSLVEAGLWDLKNRRVPAMVAEVLWNPLMDEAELERRARMIWDKQVGGWSEPRNPYWLMDPRAVAEGPQADAVLEDLGDMYRKMEE